MPCAQHPLQGIRTPGKSPSGTFATIMPMANMKLSANESPAMPYPRRKKQYAKAYRDCRNGTGDAEPVPLKRTCLWFYGLCEIGHLAISVSMPVAVTTAIAAPDSTVVPANTRLGISVQIKDLPSTTGSLSLYTGLPPQSARCCQRAPHPLR